MPIPKNYTEFQHSLVAATPQGEWPDSLCAMWYDVKGDWDKAHNIGQDIHSALGSWIHGYLHIKEGDEFNARYWYNRAKRKYPVQGLEAEQKEIVEYILKLFNNPNTP
ncbi:hypothetical protein K8352_10115 [Flavobacteriaceae bacterium F89]|uniref:Uncharacterized protein n=1 Tax=Cerina litoralis TaxID=2874477 RepID=A0AAE3JPJ2_9FLAO|nr:hypothetical protein [Cerina litoralis]MCG2461101.1 hypothetical protein [Cerina litoralis]